MKKKGSKKKVLKVIVGNEAEYVVVNMQDRNRMRLNLPERSEASDGDILSLQELARKETEEIKLRYYATNTPIIKIKKRTLPDAVRQYVGLKLRRFRKDTLMS